MIARNVLLGLALLLGGCAFEIDNAMEMDSLPGEEIQTAWLKRDRKSGLGPSERLALQVVKDSGKTKISGTMTAWLMDEDIPYAVVAVDDLKADGLTARTLYRFREEEIEAHTHPEYVEAVEPGDNRNRREQYAREVAIQAMEGTQPLLPLMYEGKYVYSARYDGSCLVVVSEKNSKRKVTGTFNIDICKDRK